MPFTGTMKYGWNLQNKTYSKVFDCNVFAKISRLKLNSCVGDALYKCISYFLNSSVYLRPYSTLSPEKLQNLKRSEFRK